jgi:hypothetical protein
MVIRLESDPSPAPVFDALAQIQRELNSLLFCTAEIGRMRKLATIYPTHAERAAELIQEHIDNVGCAVAKFRAEVAALAEAQKRGRG